MGLPGLAAMLKDASSKESGFKVWRRNWDIVLAFLSVATQWRAIARGLDGAVYWMGLDYTAALADLRASGFAVTPKLWAGVKTMERAARDALNGVAG